ncbi:MAG: tautomerase family protein [Deltaproteobacteria bacterium]|nr:tautomerase family protein [Deltaproteobacteria bacterium]
MPLVQIEWVEGRTIEQKREIARRVTDTLTQVAGCPAEAVTVIFNDHPRHDIAKAGKLMSD